MTSGIPRLNSKIQIPSFTVSTSKMIISEHPVVLESLLEKFQTVVDSVGPTGKELILNQIWPELIKEWSKFQSINLIVVWKLRLSFLIWWFKWNFHPEKAQQRPQCHTFSPNHGITKHFSFMRKQRSRALGKSCGIVENMNVADDSEEVFDIDRRIERECVRVRLLQLLDLNFVEGKNYNTDLRFVRKKSFSRQLSSVIRHFQVTKLRLVLIFSSSWSFIFNPSTSIYFITWKCQNKDETCWRKYEKKVWNQRDYYFYMKFQVLSVLRVQRIQVKRAVFVSRFRISPIFTTTFTVRRILGANELLMSWNTYQTPPKSSTKWEHIVLTAR